MALYVVEDGSTVRGLADTVSLRNRIDSKLDPVRWATAAEITEAGFEVPAGQPA
jgi:hypothetical protein